MMTALVLVLLGAFMGASGLYLWQLWRAQPFDQGDDAEVQPSDPHLEVTLGFVRKVTSGDGYR